MNDTKINDQIIAKYVLLVLGDGTQYGKITTQEALSMASEKDLDLMQVTNNDLPICKFVDYGKMKYEKSKKEKHSKHNRHHTSKGMRIKSNIAQHDLDTKSNQIRDFLGKGLDVRVSYTKDFGIRRLDVYTKNGQIKSVLDDLEKELKDILNTFSDVAKWDNISRAQNNKKVSFFVILRHIPKK